MEGSVGKSLQIPKYREWWESVPNQNISNLPSGLATSSSCAFWRQSERCLATSPSPGKCTFKKLWCFFCFPLGWSLSWTLLERVPWNCSQRSAPDDPRNRYQTTKTVAADVRCNGGPWKHMRFSYAIWTMERACYLYVLVSRLWFRAASAAKRHCVLHRGQEGVLAKPNTLTNYVTFFSFWGAITIVTMVK